MGLEENVLDARQEEYITWLCTAPPERVPPTKGAFGVAIGADPTTLRRWEKKEVFKKEWQARVDALQGSPERSQRLLDTLYDKAISGDIKAAQLYLQATNRMAPPTINVKSESTISELSDKDLEELISAVAKQEKTSRNLRVV